MNSNVTEERHCEKPKGAANMVEYLNGLLGLFQSQKLCSSLLRRSVIIELN
jgi:hypothetical protein